MQNRGRRESRRCPPIGVAAIAPAILERWFSPQFRASHPEVVADAGAMMVATPAAGYVACCAALRDFDVREELSHVAAPTLVIAGLHDQSTPSADGRFLAEHIAGARFHELDAAHISNIEQPVNSTPRFWAFSADIERRFRGVNRRRQTALQP